MTQDMIQGWLTTTAAETLTGYAQAYLRRLAARGRVEARKVGRDWLIHQESLLAYKAQMEALGDQRHNPWRGELLEQGLGRRGALGSLFALVLDRRGQLVDGDLAGGRVGIVDVGTLTTNFILVDRLRYVEVGSDSITSGTAEMLQKVAKDLKREYGLDWGLQLGKVDQAVRERAVAVYGDRVNIAGLVGPHLEALADTVVSKARSLWGSGVELKAVVATGGGSLELAPFLRRAYPHTRTVGGDPQFANAAGYLRAGLRRFGG